jgi:hypothetical protein
MQGAMYHIEQEGVSTPCGPCVTEMFVYLDEHGLNLYYVEDDYLVQEPYVFADEGHLEVLGKATFKGLLTFDVDRHSGHPLLTREQRYQWDERDQVEAQVEAGDRLMVAFDDVVNTFMGSTEDAKKQALAWLEEQYDPEYAKTLPRTV